MRIMKVLLFWLCLTTFALEAVAQEVQPPNTPLQAARQAKERGLAEIDFFIGGYYEYWKPDTIEDLQKTFVAVLRPVGKPEIVYFPHPIDVGYSLWALEIREIINLPEKCFNCTGDFEFDFKSIKVGDLIKVANVNATLEIEGVIVHQIQDGTPQFQDGREYLLFLESPRAEGDFWRILGGGDYMLSRLIQPGEVCPGIFFQEFPLFEITDPVARSLHAKTARQIKQMILGKDPGPTWETDEEIKNCAPKVPGVIITIPPGKPPVFME
jgi:hypothetical protein